MQVSVSGWDSQRKEGRVGNGWDWGWGLGHRIIGLKINCSASTDHHQPISLGRTDTDTRHSTGIDTETIINSLTQRKLGLNDTGSDCIITSWVTNSSTVQSTKMDVLGYIYYEYEN